MNLPIGITENLISICCGVIYSPFVQHRNRIYNHIENTKIWYIYVMDNLFHFFFEFQPTVVGLL